MKKYAFQVSENDKDSRLDHFLYQSLNKIPDNVISRSQVRKLIMAGAVYLNGKRVKIASKPLFSRAQVQVFIDLARLKTPNSTKQQFEINEKNVVFEDDFLILLDKPSGLPTQPTIDDSQNNLIYLAQVFLKERDGKAPYLGIHHRLDADTSGLILFTKKEEINKGVAHLFQEHLITKKYLCIISGDKPPPDQWEIKNQLSRISPKKNKYKSSMDGSFAFTRFKCLVQQELYWLVEATPVTGRTHQIRVHLAEYGYPILGDKLYGGKNHYRLMLHAYSLEFRHPKTDEPVHIVCKPSDSKLNTASLF